MTWHSDVRLEIDVEFFVLGGGYHFDQLVDAIWAGAQTETTASPWARTWGSKRATEYHRARVAMMKETVVAVRGCVACGKPFELTAYREARGRDRVCSTECRGAARRNIELVEIGGKRKPLARWAEEHGLPLGTVWTRLKRGWDVEKALRTPLTNRGGKEEAA